jgi:hypothetical protein
LITKPLVKIFTDTVIAGKSYVVFGKIDNTTIELSTIANGTGGFIINGEIQYDRSGASGSNAGDVKWQID